MTAGTPEVVAAAQERYQQYLVALGEIIDIDSGSFSPSGVNEVADLCERRFAGLGWRVERMQHRPSEGEQQLGDLLIGRSPESDAGPNILLIGHTDTVFDDGTAAERPFTIEGDLARGPGVSDMKSGLLLGFFALEILRDLGIPLSNLTYVCNPDEEIGSPFSGPFIKGLAKTADVALVLEGARENGDVVSGRKGVIDFTIDVFGRAAHAGVEPERGRSAISEAARLVSELHGLNGRWPGVTVNVGTIQGGTRSNVIAAEASMMVDVRSPEGATLDEVEAEIERVCSRSLDPDVRIEMVGRRWHRPMEKSEASQRLVDVAHQVAVDVGFDLMDSQTGGASDACTTSAAGVPTLDGLGPIGGGDHSPAEFLVLSSIVPRMSLLAGLIAGVAERGGVR